MEDDTQPEQELRLFAYLLIQVTAEQGTDRAFWDYLPAPAVDYSEAILLAPSLPDAVATAACSHYAGERANWLLSEQEDLAQQTARTLPEEHRRTLAVAARANLAAAIASN